MPRTLAYASAFAALLLVPSSAHADSIAVTAGTGFLYWDGSLTSIHLSSADSSFVIEPYAGAHGSLTGGSTADVSTTIPVTNGGNHPLPETYRGQQIGRAHV